MLTVFATDGAPLRGRWFRLHYSQSLAGQPRRPTIRFVCGGGTEEHLLPAAVLGRGAWTWRAPGDLVRIEVAVPTIETPSPPHPEVLGEAEPRRTHHGGACFEADLRSAPQHEEREKWKVGGIAAEFRVDALRPISLRRVLWRVALSRPTLLLPFLDPTAPPRARHVAANEVFDLADPDNAALYLRERRRPLEPDRIDARLTREAAEGPVLGFVIAVTDRAEGPALQRTLGSLAAQVDGGFGVVVQAGEPLAGMNFPGLEGKLRWRDAAGQRNGPSDAVFLASLRPGDELAPEAVASLRAHLARHPALDALYADSVMPTATGTLSVQAKPDWSPAFQAGRDYVGRPCLIRSAMIRPGEPLPDVVSRVAQEGGQVGHLRRILATLAAASPIGNTPRRHAEEPTKSASRSTQDGCASPDLVRGKLFETRPLGAPQDGAVESFQTGSQHDAVGCFRSGSPPGADLPSATLVVPTKDRADLLGRLVETLFAATPPGTFNLVVVDNGTTDTEALAILSSLEARPDAQVLRRPGPFNFSTLVNAGVAASSAPVVVLLNNDCAVTRPDWLRRLVAQALEPGVGAVGARLLYPDGRLQHAGVALGLGGEAGHRDRGLPGDHPGHLGRLLVPHEVATVTAACLAVRRGTYLDAGGFDEAFPVAFNDTDFGLRLRARGLRNLLDPGAVLIHSESASRKRDDGARRARFLREAALFRERWGDAIRDDSYFHPIFTLMRFRDRLG